MNHFFAAVGIPLPIGSLNQHTPHLVLSPDAQP
jgi:creatinine amidohydrolase/Fe(II)-dependent formamide hydrolase-like protein